MKRVLLLGAGHAQLSVLAALKRRRLAGAEVLLVTAHERLFYSGMLPGLVAGRYEEDECTIDIAALARKANVPLRIGRAVALDAAARSVTLDDGEQFGYDVLCLDTGGTQERDRIPGAREHSLFVRPIDGKEGFASLWRQTRLLAQQRPLAVVVVGNGAASVELALAVRRALGPRASIALICDGTLLPAYHERVGARAAAALKRAAVQFLLGRCTSIDERHVIVDSTMRVLCDVPIIATGSDAPAWLAGSGLALSEDGFVRVGATLQSASHPHVLAAGDVIVRDDAPHPRSGVYAVRAGPVLAENLRAVVAGGTPMPYRPQPRALNLLSLANGRAIASRGTWSAQGWLMGWWKERIDRAFVRRYRVR
jgi:pyridine nucleotide-disulfide oxidoreductase family protein